MTYSTKGLTKPSHWSHHTRGKRGTCAVTQNIIAALPDGAKVITPVSNYKSFDFFNPKFGHSFIQKFVQNKVFFE